MKAIKEKLKSHNRTTTTAKNKHMLDARLPFVFKHFHWNLNKELAVWIEILPNQDEEGKLQFPDHPECGWLAITRIKELHAREAAEKYLSEILEAPGYELLTLAESEEDPTPEPDWDEE